MVAMRTLWMGVMGVFLGGCVPAPTFEDHLHQSNEIRSLMRQLNTDLLDNYNSELQKDDIRIRNAQKLSYDLVRAVEGLDQKFESDFRGAKITLAQKERYGTYTKELAEHSRTIERIVERYESEKLDGVFSELEKTCTACHIAVKGNP